MDKNTLSNYGWVVVVVIIICILIGCATPFARLIRANIEFNVSTMKNTMLDSLDKIDDNPQPSGSEPEYSQDDIDNSNGKIIGIGKTDPSYVVAVFSDDFSSVVIKKNGSQRWSDDGLGVPRKIAYARTRRHIINRKYRIRREKYRLGRVL